jgi:polysaccharide export outer membrane protein
MTAKGDGGNELDHRIGLARIRTWTRPMRASHPARSRNLRDARGGRSAAVARLLAVSALCAVACSTTVTAPPVAPAPEDYVVGAPDQLLIHILPEPEIERQVRVRPDGMISIDLVGDVQAAGRTPMEIAKAIEEKISRYKRDATVNVDVVTSPSRFVTVVGEVGRPSNLPLERVTRVTEVIGQVGGTRPFASLNNIRVIRQDGRDARVLDVRLADIQRGDLSTNVVLQEGDLVVVPPTLLARIGYTLQMIFFPFQPVVSTAGSVGGTAIGLQAAGAL